MLSINDIHTPALVIDLTVAQRNISRMADYARQHNLNLRPHSKTHKSLAMARRQLDAGAAGLAVAKVSEAHVMIRVCNDLMLAYPIVDHARAAAIADLAGRKSQMVRVCVDSLLAVDVLASAGQAGGSVIGILVDLDVGFHRTGVPTPQAALELAQAVDRAKGVRLDGLFCYPGNVSGQAARQTASALAAVQDALSQTLVLWEQHGLRAQIVSGGSTPTALQSHQIPALTEFRPGTYIYNDRNCLSHGCCLPEDCAATLVCTVISNAVAGKVVIDAGSKSLSSDRLAGGDERSGFGLIVDYPQARIVRLSEEHGEVDVSQCDTAPALGQRLRVIPNHICPCVNLQNTAWMLMPDGTIESLPVDARGATW